MMLFNRREDIVTTTITTIVVMVVGWGLGRIGTAHDINKFLKLA